MDTDEVGASPGSSSDTGGGRIAEFESPDMATGSGSACGAAEAWGCGGRAEQPRKKSKLGEGGSSSLELDPKVSLTPTQREVLERVVSTIDSDNTSIVVTNPLHKDNPIVFVTKPWESMCGFSYKEAAGRNPRLTQGEASDQTTIQHMSSALSQQRSCKVMVLNYRSGRPNAPFWNMLSISPIVRNGQMQLCLANLQDYTYHMSKLVSSAPTQFCRSAEHHQRARKLPMDSLQLRYYSRPGVLEFDDRAVRDEQTTMQLPHMQLKRLGWSNLTIEPEHLTDRVTDALQQMEARYERVETAADGEDVFVVNAELSGVACRLIVTRDTTGGDQAFRISCTRLAGDTFAYHSAFRQLRDLLGDAIEGAEPLQCARGGAGAVARRPAMPLGLVPLPAAALLPGVPMSSAPAMRPPNDYSSGDAGALSGGGGGGGASDSGGDVAPMDR